MPPRLRICPICLHRITTSNHLPFLRHLTTATATTPSPLPFQPTTAPPPLARFPLTQPPSHKPPEYRKSQLHRQYTSLLRSTPLLLLFQHSNLKSAEWTAIRRELSAALQNTDTSLSIDPPLAPEIKIQVIQAGIFESALLVVEYFNPSSRSKAAKTHPTDPSVGSSASLAKYVPTSTNPTLTHGLSKAAHDAVQSKKTRHPLRPLLSGPLAVLTLPTVSPQHLRTALSILFPKAPTFPAPTRRANPGYHDMTTQRGLQKLMLLGARVEGRVFDNEGARWVGGIEGGLEGLRGQVVQLLESFGGGLTGALEGVGMGLWLTVEGRRGMLEEQGKEKEGS